MTLRGRANFAGQPDKQTEPEQFLNFKIKFSNMKTFLKRLYAFFSLLFSFNPLRPRMEHIEYFSPNGKRQRMVSVENNLDDAENFVNRAKTRARSLEHIEDNYEDYDDESLQECYDDMTGSEKQDYEREFYEDVEHYKRRGSSTSAARSKALANMQKRHGKKGAALARFRMGVKPRTGTLTGKNIQTGASATFNINITRETFNIALPLPVEVFNVIDCLSDVATLKKYLPAGVVLANAATDATRTNFVFQFAQGVNVDTIVVSCSEVAYFKFLNSTTTDMLRVGRILYKVSNENTQTQFTQRFVIVEQTLFGLGKENPITVQNFINPSDYRKDSLIINTAFDVDKQTGIIVGMTNENVALAPNVLSLGISVSIFEQWTRNKMA